MTFRWTSEAKATVAERLVAGDTAAQIGDLIGVTRNAITGLLARDSELANIGFARVGKSFKGGKTLRFTQEERKARKRQYMAAYDQRRRNGTNIIPFPAPLRNCPTPPPQKAAPALRVVSNNVPLMVQDWLAKNGGPRKFQVRETTDAWIIRQFLADRGIIVRGHQSKWKISRGPGRPRLCRWADVMVLDDEIRLAEGLQPFAARGAVG